jgi:site-specific DNA-methyltransferase (adenine-specific)
VQIHRILASDILVQKNRQRKESKPEDVQTLAGSIIKNGLIAPVVVRLGEGSGYILVAGERRLKALDLVWFFGEKVKCGEYDFAEGEVPCIFQGDMDEDSAYEMELEENIRRVDLTWIERTEATSELYRRRKSRAQERGSDYTIAQITEEVHGNPDLPSNTDKTRMELLVAPHLSDPEVRKQSNVRDAFKILKRREETQKSVDLARRVGARLSSLHDLRLGDCFDLMPDIVKESFDVILTDPPYGMGAETFGDGGGHQVGEHFYDDSWTTWNNTMLRLGPELFRLAKPQAHLYIFCDVDNFILLKQHMQTAGWKTFRTPLVWHNPTSNRAPWPEMGPMRRYQLCMYAVKGDRQVNKLQGDVLIYPSDDNLGHHAQKPVDLFIDLLQRSARPADAVFDPFAGTGTILPAAHELKCRATAIEMDEAAYGIAAKRLGELK